MTLFIVLSFPVLLLFGYGLLLVLSGRDVRVVSGPIGFLLYPVLLSIPAGVVLGNYSGRVMPALNWYGLTPIWVTAGLLVGVVLWVVQRWVLPGRTPDASERVWVGPSGRIGFIMLMIPLAYIVLAEEVVWRAYLIPELGLALAAGAFALHHYHFGLRHVVFSFLAGLVWGGLFLLAESLWPAVASHFMYNVLAWQQMRQTAAKQAIL